MSILLYKQRKDGGRQSYLFGFYRYTKGASIFKSFEKPEIIILDDDTIVGNIDKLLAKDSLLLILDKELNALHVFDRSGEFKYNIGSQGVVRESIRCCVILPLIRKGMSMP